jgi:hypothetical protein
MDRRLFNSKNNRDKAIKDGLKVYHGMPCKHCGNTLKFVSSYGCATTECYWPRTRNTNIKATEKYRNTKKGYNVEKKKLFKYRYGIKISDDEYSILFKEQKGRCKVCGRKEMLNKRLSLDHNHKTNNIRGLLCHFCNAALGMLREDVNIMKNMIKYVESYS